MGYRIEQDSMGEIEVDEDRLWGAQTERSRRNFRIGREKMPIEIVHNLALIKQSAAIVNGRRGVLPTEISEVVARSAAEVAGGHWDSHFPLSVWQTGSGTQTNMNVNEVIAKRAEQLAPNLRIHPNDHVNRGQSSNDCFPSAIHMTMIILVEKKLLPALDNLAASCRRLAGRYEDVIKIGRTHLQDATPMTVGQEVGAWASMLETSRRMIADQIEYLRPLAIGGTAVGTGLNTVAGFGEDCAALLSELTGSVYWSEPDKFRALSSRDAVLYVHGGLEVLATNLMKIAGDLRLLASGPRSGIGELILPANEPGSSIMPGKVNPTQCEAVTMVGVRVVGNQTTVALAASQGQFQLNVYLPVLADTAIQSIHLLADACVSFTENCMDGVKVNHGRTADLLGNSLMLVTALTPHVGYDAAAKVAKYAHEEGLSLKEAGLKLAVLSEAEWEAWVNPENMIRPGSS